MFCVLSQNYQHCLKKKKQTNKNKQKQNKNKNKKHKTKTKTKTKQTNKQTIIICILRKIAHRTKNDIEILVGQAVFTLWIKTVKILF